MTDRRQAQANEIRRRIQNEFAPHVLARIDAMIAAELARTDGTETVVIELPDSHGAKAIIHGFTPTLGQKLRARIAG